MHAHLEPRKLFGTSFTGLAAMIGLAGSLLAGSLCIAQAMGVAPAMAGAPEPALPMAESPVGVS